MPCKSGYESSPPIESATSHPQHPWPPYRIERLVHCHSNARIRRSMCGYPCDFRVPGWIGIMLARMQKGRFTRFVLGAVVAKQANILLVVSSQRKHEERPKCRKHAYPCILDSTCPVRLPVSWKSTSICGCRIILRRRYIPAKHVFPSWFRTVNTKAMPSALHRTGTFHVFILCSPAFSYLHAWSRGD